MYSEVCVIEFVSNLSQVVYLLDITCRKYTGTSMPDCILELCTSQLPAYRIRLNAKKYSDSI